MKKLFLATVTVGSIGLLSCGKENDTPTPSGPKEYEVEYRVTSTGNKKADVIYTNETGALNNFSDVTLPYTVKFKRTMKTADAVSILASVSDNGTNNSVTGVILLDGKEVKKETAQGTSVAQVNMVHVLN